MSDSLLDQALRFCHDTLLEMCDTSTRRQLQARLGVLERAAWSLALLPATEQQVISLAKLVLALRDDVSNAKAEDERFARMRHSSVFAIGRQSAFSFRPAV
jgi:hypothetical protein